MYSTTMRFNKGGSMPINQPYILTERAAFLLKKYIRIGVILFIFTLVSSFPVLGMQIINGDYALSSFPGTGGTHAIVGDYEIASGSGQGQIGLLEQSDKQIGLGLYYLILVVAPASVPPPPLAAYLVYLKDYGIEWISINWTG